MSHDLLAELTGYQAELTGHEQHGRDERAAAVRGEIDRVIEAIKTQIDQQLDAAEGHEDNGQDVLAAGARVEAKRLARTLPDEHRPGRLRALYPQTAGAESADAASLPDKAVHPRRSAKATTKGGE
ncbi:hypothetical protein ACQPYK_08600 [Streptosporangium sp. CA-135522]|uniref:hypothetical protein n=1 Tax=Streptosporangium sp. CA-135522 TaxID=3240072 RepID=UPI003D8D1E43